LITLLSGVTDLKVGVDDRKPGLNLPSLIAADAGKRCEALLAATAQSGLTDDLEYFRR
jgi:hypothetical protein